MTELDELHKIYIGNLSRTTISQVELLRSIKPVDALTGKQTATATHIIEETCRLVAIWGPLNASGTGNGVCISHLGAQLHNYLRDDMWGTLISELQLRHPEHVEYFTSVVRLWYK